MLMAAQVTRSLKFQMFATTPTSLKWKMLKSAFSSSPPSSPSVFTDQPRTSTTIAQQQEGKSKLLLGLDLRELRHLKIPGIRRAINIDAASQARHPLSVRFSYAHSCVRVEESRCS